jgi:ATP-dependent helicase/nuclease subunit B
LQKVYMPFKGQYVDPELLQRKTGETEQFLMEAYQEHYREGDLDHGKNHLIFKASHFLLNQLIMKDVSDLKSSGNPSGTLKILSLESQFSDTLSCTVAGKAANVRIKGKTDRIDQWEDMIRIIDYKTGSVQAGELKIPSWERLISDPKMAKAFQLLLYAYLFYRNNKSSGQKILTGNITLRKISDGFLSVRLPDEKEIDDESMNVFVGLLSELLARILDPEIPFTQTDDPDHCAYCPFVSICTR